MTASISPVVRALEDAWDEIMIHHHDLPHVVIIVASGHETKQKRYGHFAPQRWNANGENYHEIMISGEGLQRGAAPVMTTLLHEAAHALAAVRGIQDTSRQGRYHNKRFRELATEVGIQVEQDSSIGWSVSEMGDLGGVRYAKQIGALADVLNLYRNGIDELAGLLGKPGGGDDDDETPKRKSTVPCCCGCEPPRTVRMSPATLEAGPIVCGICDDSFVERVD